MSDSVYSGEECDIEEAERRTTIKPGDSIPLPLNLRHLDKDDDYNLEKKAYKKRRGKCEHERELKWTSERDSTPYLYLIPKHEHGVKENASSTYSLGLKSSPSRPGTTPMLKPRVKSSPSRLKPKTPRHSRPTTPAHRSQQTTVHWPIPTQERHSRRSIYSHMQA